jgi:hypothetical protein
MQDSETKNAERNSDFPILILGVTLHSPKLKPNAISFAPTVGAFAGSKELVNGKLKLNAFETLLTPNASFNSTNKLWPVPGETFEIMEESEIHSDAEHVVPAMLEDNDGLKDENWEPRIVTLTQAVEGA